MRIKRSHVQFGLALCALVAGLALLSTAVLAEEDNLAATTPYLRTLTFGYSDTIYNYDFSHQAATPESDRVDWAVSLFFYDDAFVDRIKSVLSNPYAYVGSEEKGYMKNAYQGTGWVWDSDSGAKTDVPFCLNSDGHYRIYAPGGFGMYNPYFGYYVFGTTHHDHHEGCDAWFDGSEGTEQNIASILSSSGYPTYYDYAWFYNAQYDQQGNHYWDNDGYATYVDLQPGGGGGCGSAPARSPATNMPC